jgi:hypothetical protein
VKFPDGAVRCEPGDHLLHEGRLFEVRDIVALSRLVVLLRGDEPVDLVGELPDGTPPAYAGPHLLLRVYERRFDDREAASTAIAQRAFGDGTDPICRPLTDFPAATTDVIRADRGDP